LSGGLPSRGNTLLSCDRRSPRCRRPGRTQMAIAGGSARYLAIGHGPYC
jgi:hypothetical protein